MTWYEAHNAQKWLHENSDLFVDLAEVLGKHISNPGSIHWGPGSEYINWLDWVMEWHTHYAGS